MPESLEWDEFDVVSQHALAFDAHGQAIGTGRLLPDGHIGRMAVLNGWRSRGIGGAILGFLVDCARRRGDTVLHLNAQTHAIGSTNAMVLLPTAKNFRMPAFRTGT